jgi:hypothetical protein
MRVFTLIIISLLLSSFITWAQDTIVLNNGKIRHGLVLEAMQSEIKYNSDGKNHSLKASRVFSINKADGSKEMIFKLDSMDEPGINMEQMQLYVTGERAAQTGYHNNLNKVVAFAAGAGFSFFSIYGLIGPAIYTSVVGSSSPNINKQSNLDTSLMLNTDYQEGYFAVARNKKIRNSFIAGMLGFAVGFTAQSIIGNNVKR